jgi:hypothetical protein
MVGVHKATAFRAGTSDGPNCLRLPELRNNSAEKRRLGCQDPTDPAFGGAPVVHCDVREKRRDRRERAGTSLLPSDRSELCFERLLGLLGREYAPRVDVSESFANRR